PAGEALAGVRLRGQGDGLARLVAVAAVVLRVVLLAGLAAPVQVDAVGRRRDRAGPARRDLEGHRVGAATGRTGSERSGEQGRAGAPPEGRSNDPRPAEHPPLPLLPRTLAHATSVVIAFVIRVVSSAPRP